MRSDNCRRNDRNHAADNTGGGRAKAGNGKPDIRDDNTGKGGGSAPAHTIGAAVGAAAAVAATLVLASVQHMLALSIKLPLGRGFRQHTHTHTPYTTVVVVASTFATATAGRNRSRPSHLDGNHTRRGGNNCMCDRCCPAPMPNTHHKHTHSGRACTRAHTRVHCTHTHGHPRHQHTFAHVRTLTHTHYPARMGCSASAPIHTDLTYRHRDHRPPSSRSDSWEQRHQQPLRMVPQPIAIRHTTTAKPLRATDALPGRDAW